MGLFSSKSKSSSSSEPWMPFSNYLRGKKGENNNGLPSDAYDLYRQGGFQPGMQGVNDQYTNYLANTGGRMSGFSNAANDMLGFGRKIAGGQFDSKISPVANVDMNQERAGMGVLDPTNALSRLLSGRPDNPYLDAQSNAMIGNLTRNLNENVMPGLRSSAAVSGQYGGSRQGIAEGLAASRMNQDLAPALTNLYGTASENAQNRMMGTSQHLNDQAYNTGFGNANIDFRNNDQTMQQNTMNLANRMQGLNAGGQAYNMSNSLGDMYGKNYGNYLSAMQMPNQMDWQNMGNYTGVMYPGAQLGGSSKSKSSQSPSAMSSIMGIGAGAAGLFSGMGGMEGLGKMFGGTSGGGMSPGMSSMMSGNSSMFDGPMSYPMLQF